MRLSYDLPYYGFKFVMICTDVKEVATPDLALHLQQLTKTLTSRRALIVAVQAICLTVCCRGVIKNAGGDKDVTRLILFGQRFEERNIDSLRKLPHAVETEWGYDGQFYAQLALSPTLEDQQLDRALDNPAYRSRRILFSWTAWVMGLGQPAWVLRAFAIQNILFWFGCGILLWAWLPPISWFNCLRWLGLMLSAGWVYSVRGSLTDGPALVVLLSGVLLIQRGYPLWGASLLGIAALGKETSLLAGLGSTFEFPRTNKTGWVELCWTIMCRATLVILPLAIWLTVIVERFDAANVTGCRNFSLPFVAFFGKGQSVLEDIARSGWLTYCWAAGLAWVGLTAQIGFFLSRRQWTSLWWRIGVPYAVLALFLGEAVFEGYPSAFGRALLPLLAAFNLTLPPTRKGWLLMLAGNLGLFQGLHGIGLI